MRDKRICIVGLGYVGLPLALELAKVHTVFGYDTNATLVRELNQNKDPNGEVPSALLTQTSATFFDELDAITSIDFWIIAVPTPVTKLNSPDLRPLLLATQSVATKLEKGSIVIYESTVYPGCTEEECLPVLQKHSDLVYGTDYHIAYSPERINPGDKNHTIANTIKVVSGDDSKTSDTVAQLYESVVTAGIHKAPSIKVAEASKIIENAQRDINIAFMNEVSIMFDLMGINTKDVLEAAKTKWNFLDFHPGLVGGHCIGVDPYYLTHKAKTLGYNPEIILAGRKVNDNLSKHIVNKILRHIDDQGWEPAQCRALVLGVAFKENVGDIRNSKVIDVIHELEYYNIDLDVIDPHVSAEQLSSAESINLVSEPSSKYQIIILATNHDDFGQIVTNVIEAHTLDTTLFVDIKGRLAERPTKYYWSL